MIFDRPLTSDETAYLRYWKTVCNQCLGWSDADTESWVKEQIKDRYADIFDRDPYPGSMSHPLESILRLFVPKHLREKFHLGTLKGLREFFNGLENVLWIPHDQLYYVGFSADFDWHAARMKIKRLTEAFISQNQE